MESKERDEVIYSYRCAPYFVLLYTFRASRHRTTYKSKASGPTGRRRRVRSQLVPLLVLVLEHELVSGGGELGGLRVHALGAVFQLRQLVAALHHQHVRARHVGAGRARARAQLLQLRRAAARDVLGHRAARLAAALADCGLRICIHVTMLVFAGLRLTENC